MQSIVRNVKDIEADDRRSLEHMVGQPLQENQEVIIRVVDLDVPADEDARRRSLARAAEIARRTRANAATGGVTELEVDAQIDEAIRHARLSKRQARP